MAVAVLLGATVLLSAPPAEATFNCSTYWTGVQSYEATNGQWAWGVRATGAAQSGFAVCNGDNTDNYVYTGVGINATSNGGWIRSAYGGGETDGTVGGSYGGSNYFSTYRRNSGSPTITSWVRYPLANTELYVQNVYSTSCYDNNPNTPTQSACLVAYAGLIPMILTVGVDQWAEWGSDQRYMYGSRASYATSDITGDASHPGALQALRILNSGGWVAHPNTLTLTNNNNHWGIGPIYLNSFQEWNRPNNLP